MDLCMNYEQILSQRIKEVQPSGIRKFFDILEEMKDALKLKSKSGIHRLITALEERGFLKRRAHRVGARRRHWAVK